MTCSVGECPNPVKCRGVCSKHYYRLRKHGDPTVTLRTFSDGLVHGTAKGYKHHKCRCDECREAKRASDAAWRSRNRETVRAASRRQRERQPEYMAAARRAWKQRNPEKVKGYTAARAAVPFTEAAVEYGAVILRDPCVYCGGKSGQIDHIQPIARGGDSEWNNLAPACAPCNGAKGAKTLLAFLLTRT